MVRSRPPVNTIIFRIRSAGPALRGRVIAIRRSTSSTRPSAPWPAASAQDLNGPRASSLVVQDLAKIPCARRDAREEVAATISSDPPRSCRKHVRAPASPLPVNRTPRNAVLPQTGASSVPFPPHVATVRMREKSYSVRRSGERLGPLGHPPESLRQPGVGAELEDWRCMPARSASERPATQANPPRCLCVRHRLARRGRNSRLIVADAVWPICPRGHRSRGSYAQCPSWTTRSSPASKPCADPGSAIALVVHQLRMRPDLVTTRRGSQGPEQPLA